MIPSVSPFSPYTYLVAFLLVLGVSIIKDGIEDYERHVKDNKLNSTPSNIITYNNERDFIIVKKKTVEDIDKGDFILVTDGEKIPADIILLNGKSEYNRNQCTKICFVETSNIDGESNLKKKINGCRFKNMCRYVQNEQFGYDEEPPNSFRTCVCDRNAIKYASIIEGDVVTEDYEGIALTMEKATAHIDNRNILLRGSVLKNTSQIIGIVISVGSDTKLARTIRYSRIRTSIFEKKANIGLLFVLFIYFILLTITSTLCSRFLTRSDLEYLELEEYLSIDALKLTGTNYILFSYLIPLSLYVTLEVARVFHSYQLSFDEDMTIGSVPTECRNSNVIEDLGTVDCILTDKTGTLTKNDLALQFVNPSRLLDTKDPLLEVSNFMSDMWSNPKIDFLSNPDLMFLLCLLACHDVDFFNGRFEGVSADEISILKKLSEYGVIFKKREESMIYFSILGEKRKAEILLVLPFRSAAQKMSVVVKFESEYYILTKGSDQALIRNPAKMFDYEKKMDLYNRIKNVIDSNSSMRTLVMCYRKLTSKEVTRSIEIFKNFPINGKTENLDRLFDTLEIDLIYLGATFIEDRLQDDVKNTIESFYDANLNVWMITGDKKETAISCAIGCGIVQTRGQELNLDHTRITSSEEMIQHLRTSDYLIQRAIVYRATPKCKANIAQELVKKGLNVLSVGDGNNDVPMLQSSSIGIGIKGKEGTEASLCGDFAIPEFQCLKKLILVYGRYNQKRFSKLIIGAYYKNMLLVIVQFYYNFFNGYSGKSAFNSFFLNFYNILFTSAIPFTIALFDKDYPEEELLRKPQKYREIKNFFDLKDGIKNLMIAILNASLIFWLSYGILYPNGFSPSSGKLVGYKGMNNFLSLLVFFSVILGQIRAIEFITIYSYIGISFSICLYFITIFGIQEIDNVMNAIAINLYGIPAFYMGVIMTFSSLIIVDPIIDVFRGKFIKGYD